MAGKLKADKSNKLIKKENAIPKLGILLLISIIVTSAYLSRDGESPVFNTPTPQKSLATKKVMGRYLAAVVKDDLSLTLYRNKATRRIIIEFYNNFTHSTFITKLIMKYANIYRISPPLVFALCKTESGFNADAVNINEDESIDRGLFQLNSKSFPYLNEKDFFSAATNTLFGIRHLKACLDRGQNEIVALSIYNAGENRVTTNGTPLITLNYVSRVLSYREMIESKLSVLIKSILSS
ncbi:MAG: lytic transglycosylase domain-containing protein [Spirochaetia bacterium]